MDLGWATTRGRARWATVLGIVVALALIGGSLLALTRSILPFDGWPSGPESSAGEQYLPQEPPTVIGVLPNGGTPGPSGLGGGLLTGSPLAPSAPAAGGGTGAGATPSPTARGGTGGRGGGAVGGGGGGGGPAGRAPDARR